MKTFDDFDGLALFVRVAQAGGLAAAERSTGISKAALSRRLSALEDKLNVRLIRRTKKGCRSGRTLSATLRPKPRRIHARRRGRG
ncbi:LysR family transcriptional regulator [Ochrobactrum sp. MYb379]|uniref:LysR family transcriptional regulator n=1 Tax=Ochrobactrum sp. MYb379 TaxID=2745275 RepID=UPI0030B30EBE